MKRPISMVLFAALVAYGLSRLSDGSKRQELQTGPGWWRRPIVLVAVLVAVLIILTPEFFALGLIGDTAFFDLLVLLISLQLQGFGFQARSWLAGWASKAISGVTTPRWSYLLVLSAWAGLGSVVSSVAAAWRRLSS